MHLVSHRGPVVLGAAAILLSVTAAAPAQAYWGGGFYAEPYSPYYAAPPAYYYEAPRIVYAPPPYYDAPAPMRPAYTAHRAVRPARATRLRAAPACAPTPASHHDAASASSSVGHPGRTIPAKPTFGSRPTDVPASAAPAEAAPAEDVPASQ